MRSVLSVALAAVFPLVLLAWLFTLSYLEDTLPTDMRGARRKPDPPPILQVPVRRPTPVAAPVSAPEPAPAEAGPAEAAPGQPARPVVPAEVALHPTAGSGRIDELVEAAAGGPRKPKHSRLAG
jgi:hypothetical protein